jgi:hypothetical protein
MPPPKRFHLVFSFVMGLMMFSVMTFVITAVNVGFVPEFSMLWLKAFAVAYVAGVPVIFFFAPLARRLTARLTGINP